MEAQKNENISEHGTHAEGSEHETKATRPETDESHVKATSGKQEAKATGTSAGTRTKPAAAKNELRKLRMDRMVSKAELARRAGVSTLTIDRVERGLPCRMDTKRKILEALGLTPDDRAMVFGKDDD